VIQMSKGHFPLVGVENAVEVYTSEAIGLDSFPPVMVRRINIWEMVWSVLMIIITTQCNLPKLCRQIIAKSFALSTTPTMPSVCLTCINTMLSLIHSAEYSPNGNFLAYSGH
jgi:hypothetical protein